MKLSTAVIVGAAVVSAYFTYRVFKEVKQSGEDLKGWLNGQPESVPGASVPYNLALQVPGVLSRSVEGLADSIFNIFKKDGSGINSPTYAPDPALHPQQGLTPAAAAAVAEVINGTHPYQPIGPNGFIPPTSQTGPQLTGGSTGPAINPDGTPVDE